MKKELHNRFLMFANTKQTAAHQRKLSGSKIHRLMCSVLLQSVFFAVILGELKLHLNLHSSHEYRII